MKTKQRILVFLAGVLLGISGTLTWLFCFRLPNAHEINDALYSTIIPKYSVKDVTYPEAIEIVLRQVHQEHPELRRVPLIYRLERVQALSSPNITKSQLKFTLELHDVPAGIVLKYIAGQTGCGCATRDGAIYYYESPPVSDDGADPPLTARERFSAWARETYWNCYLRFTSGHPFSDPAYPSISGLDSSSPTPGGK